MHDGQARRPGELKIRIATSSLAGLLVAFVVGFEPIWVEASPKLATPHKIAPSHSPVVSRVEGPSNFSRLGLTIGASAMGSTGLWGPPLSPAAEPSADISYSDNPTGFTALTGADLYRLDCQPCHKADGGGAPPEINAIIGPVQATSAALMESRMRERGRPISSSFARELAAGSKKDLLDRLKNGGKKMPAFGYLADGEIAALVRYLNLLAGVPGTASQQSVTEPTTRVGELLVKGTCHICHDATGRWPDPEELLQGSIPPIGGFTTEKSIREFVGKVRHGNPVVMGKLKLPYRGRMPVFNYLTDQEVVSAYRYLMSYPPQTPGRRRKPQN